jgi:hyperosmotically inducible periplasmic protein
MFRGFKKLLYGMILPTVFLGATQIGLASTGNTTHFAEFATQAGTLADQVRHELVTLPFFGVFDNLNFTIEDSNTVVLSGQVVRPILKSDAEAVVSRIKGVSKVVNNIEVLPLSAFDDAIRLQAYRAIYWRSGFEKYALQANTPIKIIVKNGNITLEGMIGNQMEKTIAFMAARSVPGAFEVIDNLRIG